MTDPQPLTPKEQAEALAHVNLWGPRIRDDVLISAARTLLPRALATIAARDAEVREALRMVGAFVHLTAPETRAQALVIYQETPGLVHDLTTMAGDLDTARERVAVLVDLAERAAPLMLWVDIPGATMRDAAYIEIAAKLKDDIAAALADPSADGGS